MAYFKFHKKNYWESSKSTDSKRNTSRENHAHFISCKPPHKTTPESTLGLNFDSFKLQHQLSRNLKFYQLHFIWMPLYKFTDSYRKFRFSFDGEKARLFEPPIRYIFFEKPLTSVWLTLQICMCSIVVKRLVGWRKPLINLLHYNRKMKPTIHLQQEPEIIPSWSSLIISSVIWIFGSTPTSYKQHWDEHDCFLATHLDW